MESQQESDGFIENEDDAKAWLISFGELIEEDAAPVPFSDTDELYGTDASFSMNDSLNEVIKRIGTNQVDLELYHDYRQRTRLIANTMGSLALCRGARGDCLFQAGAVDALMTTLVEMQNKLGPPNSVVVNKDDSAIRKAAIQLAIAAFGAVRDLSCGKADVRMAIREFQVEALSTTMTGMHLLSLYLKRYHGIPWKDLDRMHLRLLTNVIGAMRNVTHSTRENCLELHQHGVSDMLIWRLVKAGNDACSEGELPADDDTSREGYFRAASTLINMAEKCQACAQQYASNPTLIYLLVEASGGKDKKTNLLHLGMIEVLLVAKDCLSEDEYDPYWEQLLANETTRKRSAQERQEERKKKEASVIS